MNSPKPTPSNPDPEQYLHDEIRRVMAEYYRLKREEYIRQGMARKKAGEHDK